MPKRLSPVGLHGDLEDGSVAANHANAVVLLGLTEHSQQLMGDEPVQGGYGHHGDHKGQEGIHLPGGGDKGPGSAHPGFPT